MFPERASSSTSSKWLTTWNLSKRMLATLKHVPGASILFDKFHVVSHLGDALDEVRKSEYARLTGKSRAFIKGQKYTLLSNRANLTLNGRRSLAKLLQANQRLN